MYLLFVKCYPVLGVLLGAGAFRMVRKSLLVTRQNGGALRVGHPEAGSAPLGQQVARETREWVALSHQVGPSLASWKQPAWAQEGAGKVW